MPSSDYSNAIGGGLKLKGVKSGGIDKKKKKKKAKAESKDESAPVNEQEEHGTVEKINASGGEEEEEEEKHEVDKTGSVSEQSVPDFGKTEAQKRHEERRKKRLDERLRREGVKTHKERVLELNKYLSGLSEHHDMPRIGPG